MEDPEDFDYVPFGQDPEWDRHNDAFVAKVEAEDLHVIVLNRSDYGLRRETQEGSLERRIFDLLRGPVDKLLQEADAQDRLLDYGRFGVDHSFASTVGELRRDLSDLDDARKFFGSYRYFFSRGFLFFMPVEVLASIVRGKRRSDLEIRMPAHCVIASVDSKADMVRLWDLERESRDLKRFKAELAKLRKERDSRLAPEVSGLRWIRRHKVRLANRTVRQEYESALLELLVEVRHGAEVHKVAY